MTLFFILIAAITFTGTLIEVLYSKKHKLNWYCPVDFFTNLNLSIGQVVWGLITTPLILGGFHYIHTEFGFKGLKDFLGNPVFYIFGYLFTDFVAYWAHRISHRLNFFVIGHLTHHSSKFYNYATGLRINWVYRSYYWTLFIPVALVGYDVKYFVLFQLLINAHNSLCHTRFNIRFGKLNYFLLTPEYHRVHHSSNEIYRDKNFGASLIIWDRLFGTFQDVDPETPHEFGITGQAVGHDPIHLNFHYFDELKKQYDSKYFKSLFKLSGPIERLTSKTIKKESINFKYWIYTVLSLITAFTLNALKDQVSLIEKIGFIILYVFISKIVFNSMFSRRSKIVQVDIQKAT